MKKVYTVMLALVMAASLTACGEKAGGISGEESGTSLYHHGQEVVSLLVEAARSEEYVQAHTSDPETAEILQTIGEGEYDTPKAVYSLIISDDALDEMIAMSGLDEASNELQENMRGRVLGSLATQVNALAGVNYLAATSVCTIGKTFVSDEAAENQIYFYTYENGNPIAVAFLFGEDGAVSASGTFVICEGFTFDSAEEVEEVFGKVEVEVTVVQE